MQQRHQKQCNLGLYEELKFCFQVEGQHPLSTGKPLRCLHTMCYSSMIKYNRLPNFPIFPSFPKNFPKIPKKDFFEEYEKIGKI